MAPSSGERHVPRTMSARTVASQSSASRFVVNVIGAVCRSSRASVNLAW
jgi:hypothetical protein